MFQPFMPEGPSLGQLLDMAQAVAVASARLEGRLAPETAGVLARKLRLLGSYYSNLIEGHKTSVLDIEKALARNYSRHPEKRYAQELCAAHVRAEEDAFQALVEQPELNPASRRFLCGLHRAFYSGLPAEHLFTHEGRGFTTVPVRPGEVRDVEVSVDRGVSRHGPPSAALSAAMETFASVYDPLAHHGGFKLLAAAASHHRLTWLHPFRDGNGRVARIFSTVYLARSGVNRFGLWSLARGLGRDKGMYMVNLFAADDPADPGAPDGGGRLSAEHLSGFCEFFLETCLDQVAFMDRMLSLAHIEARLDRYVEMRSQVPGDPMRIEAGRLLRAVFMRGQVARGEASTILNMQERSARRVVAMLIDDELIQSPTSKAPLTIGLPTTVLEHWFPELYTPLVTRGGTASDDAFL